MNEVSSNEREELSLELQFAESMARFFETGGLPRMAGRVWAMLLVTDAPYLSAAELCEATGASAGSISNATRMLLQFRLIEPVAVRGERRDFFAPRKGAVADIMEMRLRSFVTVESWVSEALEQFGDRSHAVEHLTDVHDLYHWYARELPKLHERYLAEQRTARANEKVVKE